MFLFLVLLISIFNNATAQQRVTNITQGSSLTPNNYSHWRSASGRFAFGFYPQGNGFAVGVWYANIPQQTVIWTANHDDQTLSNDVTLLLSYDGRLIVKFSQGQEMSISNTNQSASSASMLDTGNFVLYDSQSMILWQTFDTPTDTILPGQPLLTLKNLVSDDSATNHSSGKFQLIMQRDGNLVMYPILKPLSRIDAYWDTKTNSPGGNVSLNLDYNGQLYVLNSTGFNVITLNNRGNTTGFYRATIDADGIFRLYFHNFDRDGSWTVEWSSSSNKCDPKGLCGLNSYCILKNLSTACQCLPGFDFIDKTQQNLGCNNDYSLAGCMSEDKTYKSNLSMTQIQDITWVDNPYSNFSSNIGSLCIDNCSRDCDCQVAIFKNNQCSKQRLPLRYGKTQQGESIVTFVKVRKGRESTTMNHIERKKEQQLVLFILGIVFLTLSVFLLAIFGILVFRYRIWNYKKISSQENGELLEDVTLRSFTYEELKKATNNFRNEIGKGAFGTVFEGFISNINRVVAIKRLEKVVAEGEREFRNEMRVIGRTHHKNLVRLFGYCHDGTNRLLVYEYMNNGSLADFLFKAEQKPTWEERVEIAINIARGIFYLHEECTTQIIHCDIKPENILMDDQEGVKIADFGLSKLLMPNQSKTYTGIRGTRGYVAPEWHTNLPITVKADVYSYGIMLLEIICCRRNVDMGVPDDEVVLANWVYDCFEAKETNMLIKDEEVEESKLDRMVKVGLWCIQDDPSVRPSMKKVVLMLEGTIDIPSPPSPSFSSSVQS